MNNNKRIMNILEIKSLRAENSSLMCKFMATADKEEATALLKQFKKNVARIKQLEKEQCAFAHSQLTNSFKGR